MAVETKQLAEFKLIAFDMADSLAAGESLAASNANGAHSVVVTNALGEDVSDVMLASSPVINGTLVQVMLAGDVVGVVDEDVFDIKWLIPMTDDQVPEEDITLIIVEEQG